jgi:L-iditol 2-dehydrogenase
MKKVAIIGERQSVILDAPDPRAKEDWAVVKIHAAPMCAEYKGFIAGRKSEFMGHEAAGEVVEVAQPGRVKVGDRVVVMPQYPCGKCELCVSGDYIHCEHTFDFEQFTGSREGSATYAQYILKPSWLLPAIPEGVSYEMASLACCALGPTFAALERMQVSAFDTVLITGTGPVGLGGVVNAFFRGARVIVVESVPYRAARARLLGAEIVLDPGDRPVDVIRELTEGKGVDFTLDCSGVLAAQRLCLDAVRRRGQAAFVGECSEALSIQASPDFIRKGIALHGVWHYNLALFPHIMQVIQHSSVVSDLISHVFPMSEVQEAFEVSASHECAKIILDPWE